MRITVQRAFLIKGVRQEPGATIEVSTSFGIEMVAMGKAERAADEPLPVSGPMMVRSEPALVPPVVAQAAPSEEPAPAPAVEEAPARRQKGVSNAEQ